MNSKTAIITGASGGIGSAIAQRFSQAGYDCILIGRSIPKLDFCLSSLAPGNHLVQPTDIANEQSWNDLRKALKDEKRTCDVLVNAAGVTHASFLIRTESSVINHIIDTNLTGTILGCKTVLKSFMVPKRKGVIINIASLLAQKGGRGASVYAASKAGIVGLTRSLVTETAGTNIRINCILPGYITTNMTSEGFSDASRNELVDQIPQKRFGSPDEVADAAYFLATNEYANNCVLNLDGGLSAV